MAYHTPQEKFWAEGFGDKYILRNAFNPVKLDRSYAAKYGVTRSAMNKYFLGGLKIKNVLEVGCNIGTQLAALKKIGIRNLYGIDVNQKALLMSRKIYSDINVISGSVFDVPFKDGSFDLVFTSGVLIHIRPDDVKKAMNEIYRVSDRYIWGLEYFNDEYAGISYRNLKNRLWKADFLGLYLKYFPRLKLIKRKKYAYLGDNKNIDEMFLLKK